MRGSRLHLALIAVGLAGCGTGRKGSAGFRLPDGDPVKGRAVFVAYRCYACHRVAGETLPLPVADPPVPLRLGGQVTTSRTDGELVSSIIFPSHRILGGPSSAVQAGSLSRMGDFTETMTVRELIDLVAFLQSRYKEVPPPLYK